MGKISELLQGVIIGLCSTMIRALGLTIQLVIQAISALGGLFVTTPSRKETYGEIFFDDLYEYELYEPLLLNTSPELEEPLRTLKYSKPPSNLDLIDSLKDYKI